MKFRISKESLLDGLQQVQSVVSSRATLPILSNVLLEVEDGQLKLTTTDLDVVISGQVPVQEVEEGGSTTLPARRLAGIVRELPASDIAIEINDENTAAMRCGNSFFKILGLAADDFPPPPKLEDVKEFKVSGRRCATACARWPTPFPPTKPATCSTVSIASSRRASSPWWPPTGAASP